MCICQVFQAVCRRLAHDVLCAFWVLLAVAAAATYFAVSSDASGRISARSVIGKLFSLLSNVFPFHPPSLGLQATLASDQKSLVSSEDGGFGIRAGGGRGMQSPRRLFFGLSSVRCMDIRGNLFARWRPGGRFF